MTSTRIQVIGLPADFRFDECLRVLSRSSEECLFRFDGQSVTRWLNGRSGSCLLKLTADPKGIKLAVTAEKIDETIMLEAVSYVRAWFDADRDLQPFYRLLDEDPVSREQLLPFKGLRLVGIPDLFECLCWAIIGQQINLAFAYRLKCRLVRLLGEKTTLQGEEWLAFPRPEKVLAANAGELRGLQFSRSKIAYLKNCAEAMLDGRLGSFDLRTVDSETVREQLLAIKGVGNWTADYVLMKTFRHPESFPVGDAGLINAVRAGYDREKRPTADELYKLAEPVRGWEAYWTFYWWRTLL